MNKHPEVAAVIGKRVSQWLSTAGNLIESRIDSQRESLHEMNRLKCVDFVLIIGLSIVCALVFNLSNPKGIPLFPKSFSDEAISGIKPSEALEEQREGKAILIDARPYESFEQEHMAGALSLPLSVFDFMYDLNLGRIDKSKKIIIYGRTISKRYDEEVARKLVARGHKNVKILKEDVRFWKKKDYPVEP
jgi:rhodanese-related sulfurtransferase